MKNLKMLGAALAFALVLAAPTFADGTNTPTCVPGETHGPPPCEALIASENLTVPGEIITPPATDSVDIMLLAEIALGSLLIF